MSTPPPRPPDPTVRVLSTNKLATMSSSSSTDFGDLLDEAGNLLQDLQLSGISELAQTKGKALDLKDLYESVLPSGTVSLKGGDDVDVDDGSGGEKIPSAVGAALSLPSPSRPVFAAEMDKSSAGDEDRVNVEDSESESDSESDSDVDAFPKAALPDPELDSEFDGPSCWSVPVVYCFAHDFARVSHLYNMSVLKLCQGALRALKQEQETEAAELEELQLALEQERQAKAQLELEAEDSKRRMKEAENLASTRLDELGQAKSELSANAVFVNKYSSVISSLSSKLETAREESESVRNIGVWFLPRISALNTFCRIRSVES